MVFALAWMSWVLMLISTTANENFPTVQNTTSFCYVLAYAWTPEFCQASFPGCQRPLPYWISNFTMHGLWPQYTTTPGYPSYCTKEPFDPSVTTSIGLPLMKHYWPNVKVADNNPDYTSFWEHEWEKHGTCTGLSQKQYFQYGIELIEMFGSPTILAEAGTIHRQLVCVSVNVFISQQSTLLHFDTAAFFIPILILILSLACS